MPVVQEASTSRKTHPEQCRALSSQEIRPSRSRRCSSSTLCKCDQQQSQGDHPESQNACTIMSPAECFAFVSSNLACSISTRQKKQFPQLGVQSSGSGSERRMADRPCGRIGENISCEIFDCYQTSFARCWQACLTIWIDN
jgi:hypothetical protein